MTSNTSKRREILPQAVLKKLVRDHLLDVIYDARELTEKEISRSRLKGTLEFLDEAYAREAALDVDADERISEPGA